MGAFWKLIDDHLARMEFPPSKRRLADRLNVSPQTITNWQRGLKELPDRPNLEAVADFVGKSYGEVLHAALSDSGYARGARLQARAGRSWTENVERQALGEPDPDPPSDPDVQPTESDVG